MEEQIPQAPQESIAPANIRLLVIDIDGTLLNPQGEITPYTQASVQAAQQAGIVVTLATARRYFNTAQMAAKVGLTAPLLIVYDGALIVQHPQGTILHARPIQSHIAQQAVDVMVFHGIQPVVHPLDLREEVWTGPSEFDNPIQHIYFSSFPERVRRMPYHALCTGHADPLRVVAFAEEEVIQSLTPEIAALDCSWNTIKRGSYDTAELVVMEKGCSKASGVIAIAELLKIPLQEVMAIGDNNNDIEMLRAVGWGVAMGQAPDAVKASARAVTASNWEDGAAQAIERYALSPRQALSNSFNRATCL
jgi:5-amino-6-(5-phospho-D-ribitylamino)uracil phosphatase